MVIVSRLLDWYPPKQKHRASAKQQFWSCPGYIKRVLLSHDAKRTNWFILPITTRNDGKSLWHSILLDCADLSAMQSCSKYMFIQWTPIKVVKSLRLFGRPNRAEHRSSDTTSTYSPSYNLLFQSTWWHHDGNTMSHQQPGTNLQFFWAHIISDKSEQWLNMNTWSNDFSQIWYDHPGFINAYPPPALGRFFLLNMGPVGSMGFRKKQQKIILGETAYL